MDLVSVKSAPEMTCSRIYIANSLVTGKENVLKRYFFTGQVATQYVNPNGDLDQSEESNINGSTYNIEGITSPDGRVLGKMAHSERRDNGVAINIYGQQDIQIFESGVEYFK